MPHLRRCFFLLCMHVVLGGLLRALVPQSIPVADDYLLRSWEMDDGMPSNRILGITQTPDGYLWLATLDGLTRFDGVRFTTFRSETTPGLESDRVHAVFTAHDGSLWVGLERGGVARRVGGRFHVIAPVAPEGAEPAGWTTSFAQDASGAVWFGYEAPLRVSRWMDGQLTAYTGGDGLGQRSAHENEVASTDDGTIWYANTNGCGPFDGRRFQTIDPEGGAFVHLARAGDGGMWATRGNRLVHYHPDGSQETAADLSGLSVHVMMEDSSGTLWLGTNNAGLIRFKGGKLAKVPVVGGGVSSLFEDREGDLWVGTQSGGVNRLHESRFRLRQTKDGLRNDITYSICTDNEGYLWLAGRDNMFMRSTDRTHRMFATPGGWPEWGGIMTVVPDPAGGVWVGTLIGLLHSREGRFSVESLRDPVTALLVDRNKDLWAAIVNGPLVRHGSDQDLRLPEAGGLTHVLALAEDSAGRIWAGTEDGLVFQKSEEQFVQVPLPGARHGDGIRFIVPDGANTVWIGALKGGLYRWHDGQVDRLSSGAGLPVDDLRSLIITDEGDFWVGASRGLVRISRDEIEAVMDGLQPSLHSTVYRRDDGGPSTEFSLGFRGATTKTPDGHLWMATARGVLEILPNEKFSPAIAPLPVLIEEVRAGGAALAGNERSGWAVPPRSGPLEIRYTLARLNASERLRFRYRFSGLGDNGWVEAGDQRTVTFTRLPPGSYRVEIAAFDAGDVGYLSTPASLAFIVQAAWWETGWFRFAAGAVAILALIWAVRKIVLMRVHARIRKLEQAHALERERTRIARDIHDQLGANLTQIAITSKLLTLEPPETIPAHSQEITDLARHTAESLDEIVWAVNPHYDTLSALIEYLAMFAVDFLTKAKIACDVDIPDGLPACMLSSNVRHHLFLAVKESLNNVVKYSGARTVRLRVRYANHVLCVEVSDDGCGFEPGSEAAGSNGIRNLGERMKELGGEFDLESSPGAGTRSVFKLPLSGDGS